MEMIHMVVKYVFEYSFDNMAHRVKPIILICAVKNSEQLFTYSLCAVLFGIHVMLFPTPHGTFLIHWTLRRILVDLLILVV